MKIFIVTPSFAIHGGIRIILEWANRLTEWHDVTLHSMAFDRCDWFKIKPEVKITDDCIMHGMDCLIITSPHSIFLQDRPDTPKKVFIFAQMAEHLFCDEKAKGYKDWLDKCTRFYTSKHPMLSISQWNMDLFKEMGRTGPTYYIRNGVNFEHFPISYTGKEPKTILVEGWECGNPSKDILNIGPKVAKRLKAEGYRIIAYSQKPLKTMPEVPDEYYCKPDLDTMNAIYERATIMIKATQYDARSCAPLEAMTKGTLTVRAITKGDDDLKDSDCAMSDRNSVRVPYDLESLYNCCMHVLNAPAKVKTLGGMARIWVQQNCDWDRIMRDINFILNQ